MPGTLKKPKSGGSVRSNGNTKAGSVRRATEPVDEKTRDAKLKPQKQKTLLRPSTSSNNSRDSCPKSDPKKSDPNRPDLKITPAPPTPSPTVLVSPSLSNLSKSMRAMRKLDTKHPNSHREVKVKNEKQKQDEKRDMMASKEKKDKANKRVSKQKANAKPEKEKTTAERNVQVPSNLKNFANKLPPNYKFNAKENLNQSQNAKKEKRQKKSKRKSHNRASSPSAETTESMTSNASDTSDASDLLQEEMALTNADLDRIIAKIDIEELFRPDPAKYDMLMTDEELEKRSKTVFSLKRARKNAAITYSLMDLDENKRGIIDQTENNSGVKFNKTVNRRSFHVKRRQKNRDDNFDLVDIFAVPGAKEEEKKGC